ncbi:MAG: polysaccharide biosynthesis C-terminal domain-containing protein, partial [Lachnospiraceae bacterium]|nr:polysaccharide biosynthesis C-terminal domain-containing protein [Lachnospiraceae bacterium]
LTLARVTGSLLAAIENILIPQRLALFGGGENVLSVFGSLTGMAMPLIQLPSALLMAISVTLVPALSEARATNNNRMTAALIEKAITYTAVIGFGFAAVFAAFPEEICYIIYSQKELGSLLLRLCIICPFMYMQITISGILNGLGSHSFIFRQNLIPSGINLFFIYIFIPHWGTDAFIVGITLSLIVTSTMGVKEISKKSNIRFSTYKSIILPAICAVSAYIVLQFIPKNPTFNLYIIALSTILLFLIYLVLLFLTGALSKDDVMSFLPKKR